MKEIVIQTTADTHEDKEWIIGNLFGVIACQHIDREQLEWFNGLKRPTAHELWELTGGVGFAEYFEMASDCEISLPFYVRPDNFTPAMMRGFRSVLSEQFDTCGESMAKRRAGVL
jgi:hypothetical protein